MGSAGKEFLKGRKLKKEKEKIKIIKGVDLVLLLRLNDDDEMCEVVLGSSQSPYTPHPPRHTHTRNSLFIRYPAMTQDGCKVRIIPPPIHHPASKHNRQTTRWRRRVIAGRNRGVDHTSVS